MRLAHVPTICPCYGTHEGRPAYGARPAICGHWFHIDGEGKDATIRPSAVRVDRDGKPNPIRDLKRGASIPVLATVNLSFKTKKGF